MKRADFAHPEAVALRRPAAVRYPGPLAALVLACAPMLAAPPAFAESNDDAVKQVVQGALQGVLDAIRKRQSQPGVAAATADGRPERSGPLRNPRSEPLDVMGVRLGMTGEEAVAVLKKAGMDVQVIEASLSSPKTTFPVHIIATKGTPGGADPKGVERNRSGDRVVAWLAAPPSQPTVIMVGRQLLFAGSGEVEKPRLAGTLKEKYGPWHDSDQDVQRRHGVVAPSTGDESFGWLFNAAVPNNHVARCSRLAVTVMNAGPGGGAFQQLMTGMQGNSAGGSPINPDCGQTVGATVLPARNPQLANGLWLVLVDHRATAAAMTRTREMMAGAQASAMQREVEATRGTKPPSL
jgi:hypothetical protein